MSLSSSRNVKKGSHRSPSGHTESDFLTVTKETLVGLLSSAISVIVLTLITSALCMLSPDPSKLTAAAGIVILYVSAIVGGFASAYGLRKNKKASSFGAILCGILLFTVTGLISTALRLFMPEASSDTNIFLNVLLRALIIPMSLLGGYLCIKKPQKRQKRKK